MRFNPKRKRIFIVGTSFVLALLCILLTCLFCLNFDTQNHKTTGAGTSSRRSLPIYSVETDEKKIAISFDCAWGIDHTQTLLDIMAQENVKCTFFAVEFWVKKYPEYAKKIVDSGHELGTHSRTHSYMSKLSKAEIIDELTTSSSAIEQVTGQKPLLFRAPYGDYDNLLIDTCFQQNLYPIQWDVDSLDWKNLSAQEIAMRITGSVKNGSIILCHNNGLHTAEALPMVISTLKSRGFTFVPIGQLIYKQNFTIDVAGRQHYNG